MHQALYRKYRPRSFDDVCGQEHITSVLQYETKMGKVSHAYLFCGPRGTGKTTCAKILAKAVNCEHPIDGNPCGKCFACESIDNGSATDVLEMDAASNNGVEYIRDIRDGVNYTPAALKKRVYIIDEVHMLSQSAFNALLKTLEEPPEHVLFILATTELHKLPATIISRCQRFDFRRIAVDTIAERLLKIAAAEDMALTEDAARILAKQAQGGMRDAISLFELCGGGGHEVTAERVTEVLGLSTIETVYKTAVAVARRDIAGLFRMVDVVANSARDIAVFWQELTAFWRDMLVVMYVKEPGTYLDMTEPELRVTKDAARRFTPAALSYQCKLLDDAMRAMNRLPQTKRLQAEITLVRMCDPRLDESMEALNQRLTVLEDKVSMIAAGAPPMIEKADSTEDSHHPDNPDAGAVTAQKTDTAQNTSIPDTMRKVEDISEVCETLTRQNPIYGSFFGESDCYVSEDGTKILVRATSDFAAQMLGNASQNLLAAFLTADISVPGAVLTIEAGAAPKAKKNPVDELAEF